MTINQIPQYFGELIGRVTSGPIGFLLLVNVLLFVVGTFMEALATILILAPILAPIAQHPTASIRSISASSSSSTWRPAWSPRRSP